MNPASHVVDVTVQNFQETIDRSKEVPVVIEFYADGAEPSQQLAPVLRRLADDFQGKFILARVDVQQNQQIVQQLNVRTLPTIKIIFQGQMVQDLEGPQDEASLKALFDQLTMSPVERIKEQIKLMLEQNDRAGAIEMLQQVIAEEPGNQGLQVELADLLVMESRIDEARQILVLLPEDAPGISKPKNRISFIEKSAEFDSLAELQAAVEADAANLTAKYQYAVSLVVDDQIETALDQLLEMMKQDKSFEEDLARKTMILIFELLGKGDPTATSYRRKMFTFLH